MCVCVCGYVCWGGVCVLENVWVFFLSIHCVCVRESEGVRHRERGEERREWKGREAEEAETCAAESRGRQRMAAHV